MYMTFFDKTDITFTSSSWYYCAGWLGVKHQLTNLPAYIHVIFCIRSYPWRALQQFRSNRHQAPLPSAAIIIIHRRPQSFRLRKPLLYKLRDSEKCQILRPVWWYGPQDPYACSGCLIIVCELFLILTLSLPNTGHQNNATKQFNQKQISILHLIFQRLSVV